MNPLWEVLRLLFVLVFGLGISQQQMMPASPPINDFSAPPSSSTAMTSLYLQPASGEKFTLAMLEQTHSILQTRLDTLETNGIATLEGKRIRVELPAQSDLSEVTGLLTASEIVGFFDAQEEIEHEQTLPAAAQLILDNADVVKAEMHPSQFSGFDILITFSTVGKEKLAEYSAGNIGHFLLVTMDNTVISAPMINSEIPDGVAMISGLEDHEAQQLLAYLNAQPLPVRLMVATVE